MVVNKIKSMISSMYDKKIVDRISYIDKVKNEMEMDAKLFAYENLISELEYLGIDSGNNYLEEKQSEYMKAIEILEKYV